MKEVLNEFDEKENNNLLNYTDSSISENNITKKDIIDDDNYLEKFKQGSLSSEINYSYSLSTSSLFEEEEDKSNYPTIHNCKDFLIMLSLLMCPSFNFNYLYLPLILIGFYYFKFVLKNKMEERRKKSTFETIIFVYSLLLLIFKIVIIILITKKNKYIQNRKNTFIDAGIAYLINERVFNLVKTIIGESIIIICCICSFLIRKLFTFNNEDLNKIKFNRIKSKNFDLNFILFIFISFLIIAGLATFNKSILTFCYILPFYIVLVTFSLSNKHRAYYMFQAVLYGIIFCLFFHLLIINISNIYSIAYKFFDPNKADRNFAYKNWPKFGFYFAYYDNNDYKILFKDWAGYLLACLAYVLFSFIIKELVPTNYKLKKTKSNEEIEDEVEKKNCFVETFNKFLKICSGPYFILHIVRILAIIWIYFYRNFYSIGIFLWIFFSFIYLDPAPIKILTIYILMPMIFISLASFHLSRMLYSYFSSLDNKLKIKYMLNKLINILPNL